MENKHDCKQTFIPQLEFRRFNWKKKKSNFLVKTQNMEFK